MSRGIVGKALKGAAAVAVPAAFAEQEARIMEQRDGRLHKQDLEMEAGRREHDRTMAEESRAFTGEQNQLDREQQKIQIDATIRNLDQAYESGEITLEQLKKANNMRDAIAEAPTLEEAKERSDRLRLYLNEELSIETELGTAYGPKDEVTGIQPRQTFVYNRRTDETTPVTIGEDGTLQGLFDSIPKVGEGGGEGTGGTGTGGGTADPLNARGSGGETTTPPPAATPDASPDNIRPVQTPVATRRAQPADESALEGYTQAEERDPAPNLRRIGRGIVSGVVEGAERQRDTTGENSLKALRNKFLNNDQLPPLDDVYRKQVENALNSPNITAEERKVLTAWLNINFPAR